MKTTINQRINEIRLNLNLSVNSFAKKIEISQPTLKSIIDGNGKPSYDTIYKILINYPISAEWLILEKGEMIIRDNVQKNDYPMEVLINRIEILSAENAILKKEIEDLTKHDREIHRPPEKTKRMSN